MTPYYEDDAVTIYHGDSFDRLRDAMFDFCGGCGELADYCVCEPKP